MTAPLSSPGQEPTRTWFIYVCDGCGARMDQHAEECADDCSRPWTAGSVPVVHIQALNDLRAELVAAHERLDRAEHLLWRALPRVPKGIGAQIGAFLQPDGSGVSAGRGSEDDPDQRAPRPRAGSASTTRPAPDDQEADRADT